MGLELFAVNPVLQGRRSVGHRWFQFAKSWRIFQTRRDLPLANPRQFLLLLVLVLD